MYMFLCVLRNKDRRQHKLYNDARASAAAVTGGEVANGEGAPAR
jgi:hypothetical protein